MNDAIAEAAFRLFAERGYGETSVDQIAAAAGVSRSTFFRSYGSKEGVIFPDHDTLLQQVEERLRVLDADPLAAVTEAVKVVLFRYIDEGERARERYRLTSQVPALRDRELVSSARYQRLFRRYLSRWGEGDDAAELRAEVTAAAVVAAHNRVLRGWLRGELSDPRREIEEALTLVHRIFDDTLIPPERAPVALLVLDHGSDLADVETALRRTLRSRLRE